MALPGMRKNLYAPNITESAKSMQYRASTETNYNNEGPRGGKINEKEKRGEIRGFGRKMKRLDFSKKIERDWRISRNLHANFHNS